MEISYYNYNKTIYNHAWMSYYRYAEIFWHMKRKFRIMKQSWLCENISNCLKIQQTIVKAIVYCF